MADAGGFFIHCPSQVFNRFIASIPCVVTEMPILAIEAMKGAGMGKNSEVLVPIFRTIVVCEDRITASGSSRADPVTYTIGGQGVVVPRQFPSDGRNALKPAMDVFSQSAVPPPPNPNLTSIHAKLAENACFATGRFLRQFPFVSNPTMGNLGDFPGFIWPGADTTYT